MNPDFWLNRWQEGKTGWHQSEVEPALYTWAKNLSPTRVLVPLCGKSLDLLSLASLGHEVIGVELASAACHQFFTENKIPYQNSAEGEFHVFRSTEPSLKITIFNGNFFQFSPSLVGALGALYDRAALIALPPDLRKQYVHSIQKLIRKPQSGFQFLQIVLTRRPMDDTGPPFSIEAEEITATYGADFEIRLLSKEAVEANGPAGSKTEEQVFLLTPKQT